MKGTAEKLGLAAAAILLAVCAHAQFSATTPLPQALLSHTAVTLGGRIYVAGGISDTGGVSGQGGYLNNTYYCAGINPDGTLGAWTAASPMPEFLGLGMHAAAAHNGRLYVLGGTNLFGARNVVYFSTTNADGTLAGWQQTVPMPQKVSAHAAAVYRDRIYVTGGLVRSVGATALTYSAPVNADGTFGEWRYETPLPATTFGHRSFTRAGKLFVLGGASDPNLYGSGGTPAAGVSDAVYAAAINPDGTLGAWQPQPPLPAQLAFYGLVDTEKSVYLLGGFDGSVTNAVYFSPIAADGALGAWQPLEALPRNLLSLAAVATPDYLYSIGGGLAYIDDPRGDVYFAKIKTELKAFVRIYPTRLNRWTGGRYVNAIIGLPEADVRDIAPETVRISAVNGRPIAPIYAELPRGRGREVRENEFRDRNDDEDDDNDDNRADYNNFGANLRGHRFVSFKFDRRDVRRVVGDGAVTLKLEGTLDDGRTFTGENSNWVITRAAPGLAAARERAGLRRNSSGAGAHIPRGSFPGNPDLLLTMVKEERTSVSKEEKERRERSKKNKCLALVADAVEFGPHGIRFDAPVKISLSYSLENLPSGAAETGLKIAYWNQETAEWEIQPSVVSTSERTVSAEVGHFSLYQVVAGAAPEAEAPAEQAFSVGEVYIFPNPALAGARPKLHVAAAGGDGVTVKVFTASGRKAYETSFAGAPAAAGAGTAYELDLAGEFPSGIYYYSAEVSGGGQKVKKSGKFAVVR